MRWIADIHLANPQNGMLYALIVIRLPLSVLQCSAHQFFVGGFGLSNKPIAMHYRPDIDGIRAIAVLAVLFFHAGVPFAGGGYVGVDVFFVLSGYLITKTLLDDQSIIRFYQRRARRILPALFAVAAFALLTGVILFFPSDLVALCKSIMATMAFTSNIWFWRQSDYFAVATELWPLLHTWSLGVEEQFYIAFPLILFSIRRLSRYSQATIFVVFAAISFFASIYGMAHLKGTLVFYMAPTRAWELLVGSVLATGVIPSIRQHAIRLAMAIIGLAAVIGPMCLYSRATEFPGVFALPPVLGTAVLLWTGGERTLVGRLLSIPPLVFVGLISYSLYLWHWPLLAFGRYISVVPLSTGAKAGLLIASFAIASLSWRFIERPFRSPKMKNSAIWYFSGSGIVMLLLAAGIVILAHGFPGRFPAALTKLNADSGTTWRCPISTFVNFGAFYACPINLPSRNVDDADVVLWGDSHAQMYAPALQIALGKRTGLLVNANGCAPVMGDAATPSCGAIQRGNFALITRLPAKTVILAQNWPQYRDEAGVRLGRQPLPSERYQDGIRRLRMLVSALRKANKTVLLVAPIALPGYDPGSVIPREIAFGVSPRQPEFVDRQAYLVEYANVFRAMYELTDHLNVRVIHVEDGLCDKQRCWFVKDGHAIFADHGHITTKISQNLSEIFQYSIDGRDIHGHN